MCQVRFDSTCYNLGLPLETVQFTPLLNTLSHHRVYIITVIQAVDLRLLVFGSPGFDALPHIQRVPGSADKRANGVDGTAAFLQEDARRIMPVVDLFILCFFIGQADIVMDFSQQIAFGNHVKGSFVLKSTPPGLHVALFSQCHRSARQRSYNSCIAYNDFIWKKPTKKTGTAYIGSGVDQFQRRPAPPLSFPYNTTGIIPRVTLTKALQFMAPYAHSQVVIFFQVLPGPLF